MAPINVYYVIFVYFFFKPAEVAAVVPVVHFGSFWFILVALLGSYMMYEPLQVLQSLNFVQEDGCQHECDI